jgi:hypothetical protein
LNLNEIYKYPRTYHIEGSGIQKGDEDLSHVPFAYLAGKKLIVEEKCDGANSAVSFDDEGALLLQSRGHYLTGGHRERHFNLLKQWAGIHKTAFYDVLGSRYIMYGEWIYAKHTIFYNSLPHYFLEFDIYDKNAGKFLDTPARYAMLADMPVVSVPVLANAMFNNLTDLTNLIGHSNYIKKGHIEWLREYCDRTGEHTAKRIGETDPTTLMEGLYIKIECGGETVERLKFVRSTFLQCVELSNSHWLSRPIVPNQLAYPLENIFLPELPGMTRQAI